MMDCSRQVLSLHNGRCAGPIADPLAPVVRSDGYYGYSRRNRSMYLEYGPFFLVTECDSLFQSVTIFLKDDTERGHTVSVAVVIQSVWAE